MKRLGRHLFGSLTQTVWSMKEMCFTTKVSEFGRVSNGSLKVVVLLHVSSKPGKLHRLVWFGLFVENGNRIGSPKVSHDDVPHLKSSLFVPYSDIRMIKEIKYGKVVILM